MPDDHEADPIRQVPLDVPVWCVHGREDTTVPIEQSRAYVAAARAAGGAADLVEMATDHYAVIDPDADVWARTLAVLDRL